MNRRQIRRQRERALKAKRALLATKQDAADAIGKNEKRKIMYGQSQIQTDIEVCTRETDVNLLVHLPLSFALRLVACVQHIFSVQTLLSVSCAR